MESNQIMQFFRPKPSSPELPLFIFLPAMDGTGQLFRSQIPKLCPNYDILCLSIPKDDRSVWEELVENTINLIKIEREKNQERPIYLCGESFGGCLAMKVALTAPHLFTKLILVNPASSIRHTPWLTWGSFLTQLLPESLYRFSVFGVLPFLAEVDRIPKNDQETLLSIIQSIPQETSMWRLELLSKFHLNESQLNLLKLPVLILAGEADRLLPSVREAKHLANVIPNSEIVLLPDSGHACLLEKEIDLNQIINS